ncbi:hypothetical protein ACLOJK_020799 [Asimina triloba]
MRSDPGQQLHPNTDGLKPISPSTRRPLAANRPPISSVRSPLPPSITSRRPADQSIDDPAPRLIQQVLHPTSPPPQQDGAAIIIFPAIFLPQIWRGKSRSGEIVCCSNPAASGSPTTPAAMVSSASFFFSPTGASNGSLYLLI